MERTILVDHGGGLLVFDGQVLEYFDERNRVSDWRIHARHIEAFEYTDHGKGTFRLKVMLGRKKFQNVVFDEAYRADVQRLEASAGSARG